MLEDDATGVGRPRRVNQSTAYKCGPYLLIGLEAAGQIRFEAIEDVVQDLGRQCRLSRSNETAEEVVEVGEDVGGSFNL